MKSVAVFVACCALLTACADDAAESPPHTAPPTYVTNNTTYVTNNTTYDNTIVSGSTRPAPAVTFVQTPPPEAIETPPRVEPDYEPPRDRAPTGVATCDAYLRRVESCSRAMLPEPSQSDTLDRITAGLDTARRAWRDAAHNPSARATLGQVCGDSLLQYDKAVKDVACD